MPKTDWSSSMQNRKAATQAQVLTKMEYDDDIATAVSASLESPQGVKSTHQSSMTWSPRTPDEWSTYKRQTEAMAEAEKNKDSPGYLTAIAKSLEDNVHPHLEDQTATMPPPIAMDTSPGESPGPRPFSLDDMIAVMAGKKAFEVPRLNMPNGDTWIFIDAPPRQPEQDAESYRLCVERSHSPLVIHSATILSLSSENFDFDKAMGPTAQHRVKRRRGLVGQLPSHVKYVLDLTPPSEGEDAAHLLSELSCSEGVTKWVIAGKLWKISNTLIGGHEEVSSYNPIGAQATFRFLKSDIERNNPDNTSRDHKVLQLEESMLPIPLPYTPLRHRSAIERVLLAISGVDPGLDSAPKLWAACAVARYFGAKTLFVDYVIRWLRAYPNHNFLEVLPEVSLKIADTLQCYELCRDVFAILVGEEALGSLYRSRTQVLRPKVVRGIISVHGRKKDHLPEEYQTRIEYASKALIERVTAEFKGFASCDWIEELKEARKIIANTQPDIEISVPSLLESLKAYVRGSIYRLLCVNHDSSEAIQPHLDYQKTNGLFPIGTGEQVWNELFPRERLLTRSFWESLTLHLFNTGYSNMHVRGQYTDYVPLDRVSPAEGKLRRDGVFQVVKRVDLTTKAALYHQLTKPRNLNQPMLRFDPADPASPTGYVSVLWVPNGIASAPGVLDIGNQHREALLLKSQVPVAEGGYLILKEPRPAYQRASNNVFDQSPTRPILTKARHLSEKEHHNVCEFMKDWVGNNDRRLSQAIRLPFEYFGLLEAAGTHTGVFRVDYPYMIWNEWVGRWFTAYDGGPASFSGLGDDDCDSFNLDRFFDQASSHLVTTANKMLAMTDGTSRVATHPLSLSDFIVSLEDAEFKYLPLWAGGNDDESGGVFNSDVPTASQGFSTPGPNVHLGAGSSAASSEFDFVRGPNSYNTSTLTQGQSEGTPSTGIRSVSEHGENPFGDAEQVRAPSNYDGSEYDFGSVTSVGVESTAERLARFGLNTEMSEKAMGKLPIRNKEAETIASFPTGKQESANENQSGQPAIKGADMDEDFDSIFQDDDMGDDEEDNDFDDGNESDETVGEAKDSDDDLVLV